ncbi:hypothetical protein [Sphaerotilus montanus]|uniref:hypothetical protein n=1 Tax=Sphaerotilus montanus TaxID=522889 RepID=UPI003FA1D2F1
MKHGVCIVECFDKSDPGSEGRVLKEIFNLMQIESVLVRVKSIENLFEQIAESEMKYVHVSTHGAETDSRTFGGWWTHKGTGTRKWVQQQDIDLSCTAIVSTACRSGTTSFGKYLVDTMGCKYYIGPTGCPNFYNAALFSHLYYHKLFKTRRTVQAAFYSYEASYKNPHGFKMFRKTAA